MKKLIGSVFFDRCNNKFNNKFIYHNDYDGMDKVITITCPIHGNFQTPAEYHQQSKDGGCLTCQKEKQSERYSNHGDEFILNSKIKHKNKYNYNKTNYVNNETNVVIICSEHGEFSQRPICHLNRAQGCPKCCKKTMGGYGGYNIKNAEKFKDIWLKKQGFVYFVRMSDENEDFVKIGITAQKNIRRRFSGFKYKIEVIGFIQDNLYNLVYKEKEYLEKYKEYTYTPKKYFKGHRECFNKKICENLKNI